MKTSDIIKRNWISTLTPLHFLVLAAGLIFLSKPEASYQYFVPTVIYVVDGDTIKVNFSSLKNYPPLNIVSIRLRGIDTPESYRPKCEKERELGLKAKQFVVDLIGDSSKIRVFDYDWGKYGSRIIGVVIVNGKNLGEELVQAGLAVPYTGVGPKHNWCQ